MADGRWRAAAATHVVGEGIPCLCLREESLRLLRSLGDAGDGVRSTMQACRTEASSATVDLTYFTHCIRGCGSSAAELRCLVSPTQHFLDSSLFANGDTRIDRRSLCPPAPHTARTQQRPWRLAARTSAEVQIPHGAEAERAHSASSLNPANPPYSGDPCAGGSVSCCCTGLQHA